MTKHDFDDVIFQCVFLENEQWLTVKVHDSNIFCRVKVLTFLPISKRLLAKVCV